MDPCADKPGQLGGFLIAVNPDNRYIDNVWVCEKHAL